MTLIPAWRTRRSGSGFSDAGPIVQQMRVPRAAEDDDDDDAPAVSGCICGVADEDDDDESDRSVDAEDGMMYRRTC